MTEFAVSPVGTSESQGMIHDHVLVKRVRVMMHENFVVTTPKVVRMQVTGAMAGLAM